MKELSRIFYGIAIAFAIWFFASWIEIVAYCQPNYEEPSDGNFFVVLLDYCEYVENH